MDGLIDHLPAGSIIGIDTSPFIYQLEAAPGRLGIVAPFFQALARGKFFGVTSVLTLMELAVRPLQLGRPEVADDYELTLQNYPNLTVIDVNRQIARRAAELRAAYRLRPADSLQVSTAIVAGASTFLTNDRDLARHPLGVQVLLVDNFGDVQ